MRAERFEDDRGTIWLLRPRPGGAPHEAFERRAADAMLRHGLTGWAFGFGYGRRTLGSTRVAGGADRGTLRISRHLLTHGSPERLEDTLLHELAHAVAFRRHGRQAMNHGPLWRAVAAELGAEPRATCTGAPLLPAPHRLICRRCGAAIELFRRPKHAPHRYRHARCGGTLRKASEADR